VRELAAVDREAIARLPKAELHVHLDGSLRPATLIELSAEYGTELPARTVEALTRYMVVDDARDLVDYLARFSITLAVMQTAHSLERIAYELAVDMAAENVRYAEVRFAPLLNTRGDLTSHGAVEAVLAGLRRARRETGIVSSVIVCALRHMTPETSLEQARVAVDFKGNGVVAFDLAGPEHGHPPAEHLAAFRAAARANLPVTIHAGEAFGPASIREALHVCGANRIGHGTRLFEDTDLMAWVNDFRIPMEICLTSNVQTRVSPSFEEHPVRTYFDAGLVTTLNTDNRLMSGTTVTDEYWIAHKHLGFEWRALSSLAVMGFEAAFLPWREKQALVASVIAEIDAMDERAGTDRTGPPPPG
jgi:adenosine deaminase